MSDQYDSTRRLCMSSKLVSIVHVDLVAIALLVALWLMRTCDSRAAESDEAKEVARRRAAAGDRSASRRRRPSRSSISRRASRSSTRPIRPMPTASLIKFPVMIAAYDAIEKGKLDRSTT